MSNMPEPTVDIVIAHDQFRTMGGAERVACEIARTLDAPIYAGRVDDGVPPDDVETHELFDDRLGARVMRTHHLLQDLYQMIAWQHCPELYDADVVVQTKNNPGWFVPKDDQPVIRYLHSTPRGMFDRFEKRAGGPVPRLVKTGMRTLQRQTVPWPDLWLCNSGLVKRRLGRYRTISSPARVLYPPVRTERFGRKHAAGAPDTPYYLSLGRLEDHKRVDEIIEACGQAGVELVVAGDGAERDELEAQAAEYSGVRIAGYVSEERKRELLAGARALIMNAANEDFGLVPIEAMASGTPVIGIQDGYTQRQIIQGKSGYIYPSGSRAGRVSGIGDAIEQLERDGVAWRPEELETFAEEWFGMNRFQDELWRAVRDAVDEAAVTPPWSSGDALSGQTGDTPTIEALPDGGEHGN